jgi:hypothetical protein
VRDQRIEGWRAHQSLIRGSMELIEASCIDPRKIEGWKDSGLKLHRPNPCESTCRHGKHEKGARVCVLGLA